ncbi:MAG: DUF2125 domain-containing protein [Pseudomonadota bacterium]
MRRLLWSVPLIAVIWFGYWAAASWSLRGAIATWLEARHTEGWQAEAGLATTGFPGSIGVRLLDLALADPATGLAITARAIGIEGRALWPADITVTLPPDPITVATPQGRGALVMQEAALSLDTYPGTALEVAELGWRAANWSVTGPQGEALRAGGLTLNMSHLGGTTYALVAEAPGIAPGDAARTSLRIPAAWPAVFDVARAEGEITFDRAWDRRALEEARPQPTRIDLSLAEARWGDLRLRLAAALDVNADGVPTGTVNLQADNWPVMLELATDAGLLDPRARPQIEAGLTRLARLNGNPEALDVQLNFAAGLVAVGIIPVGPAPRFVIR